MPRFSDSTHDIANEASPVFNIPIVREDLTNEPGTIDCTLQENKNNPACLIGEDFLQILIITVLLALVAYGIIIFAAMKTKNQNLKIFLIISMFLPFLTPVTLILALLIITNAI